MAAPEIKQEGKTSLWAKDIQDGLASKKYCTTEDIHVQPRKTAQKWVYVGEKLPNGKIVHLDVDQKTKFSTWTTSKKF